MRVSTFTYPLPSLLLLTTLPARVFAGAYDTLYTTGFSNCISNGTITATLLSVSFDRSTAAVTFDAAGESDLAQNVSASLVVSAYGKDVYTKTFDPCDSDTYVEELCPVPAGNFSASGSYTIPSSYVDLIPTIVYILPNLDGVATLKLTSLDTDEEVACITASITNGKSTALAAASYAAVGVAGAALVVSGVSALAGVGSMSSLGAGIVGVGHAASGSATSSPSFVEVVGWFQSMAMNGMLSVSYPSLYRSFTQNFGFSTGLVSWDALQESIDTFRSKTGGNLTDDSVEYLDSVTLVYSGDSSKVRKREVASEMIKSAILQARDIITNVNGTTTSVNGTSTATSTSTAVASATTTAKSEAIVSGIKGYVEELSIPQSNTFMTVLIMFSIVIAAITAGILLLKVILECWTLFATFPKRLQNFRKNYWWLLAKTITNLILLLYGVWTLYCIYQFTNGDSWAAKVLAGVTLGLFTVMLLGFTWRIWVKAHQHTDEEFDDMKKGGDDGPNALYEDMETWKKYSQFYANYKKSYWWLFLPTIIYMFAKGCVIAAADGHGLVQTSGQLIIDAAMLGLLCWTRPFALKSGNWINIVIQVVRLLSLCCILVFVEELGISQTTKTITGLVLIVLQAAMTGALAILIAVNAIITIVRANPHRRKRKEAELIKSSLDKDELTPLDARNSMLLYPLDSKSPSSFTSPFSHPTPAPPYRPSSTSKSPSHDIISLHTRGRSRNGYDMVSPSTDDENDLFSSSVSPPQILPLKAMKRQSPPGSFNINRDRYQPSQESFSFGRDEARRGLTSAAAGFAGRDQSQRRPSERSHGRREFRRNDSFDSFASDVGYGKRQPQLPDLGEYRGRGI